MFLLTNAIRDYAWGSRNHIPRFLEVPPTGAPQAELWIGAHPGDPSRLPDGRTLDEAIREDPERLIGPRVRTVFGDRLPFLLKALAAAEPLSLQVHPTSQRAELGYAAEEAAGVLLGAPKRSYQDRFHKPEMVFALTRFEGMAGFRDVNRSAQILRTLDLPWADDVAARLESGPAFQTLRAVVTEMLATDGLELTRLLSDLRTAAAQAEQRGHREDVRIRKKLRERTSVSREGTRVFAQTTALVDRYPADPGVLVTLLLNHVVLAPGEAMFLGAGVIHAYTSGFGVEIMASSDNVLRAGLTPKHVDVEELLQITNFTPMPPPQWAPTTRDGLAYFEPPVTEFALTVGDAPLAGLATDGPRVVLVLDGSVNLSTETGAASAVQGEALFIEHADGALTIDGNGRVAVASVPH
ncbi:MULTISPECIES: mannose-6-phosphate isomerase, class I [unclassified Nocardioides]|uniref:mannose-6-phosphate isomerase, class I n=1 Tax=unclassified Nocardioides TaxID=2615069 RepID=UPI0009F10D84|nr:MULTISPECIES: mannose-6-phosphate isomerase, class I [unclassified Nocardioides]GAW48464.1 mannose-6-phosphate isomerase [Nocardioides sp. PD653-B2]GAW52791.1 mannose-6-phosphate isomerase [Nocardioides sp. PD653]